MGMGMADLSSVRFGRSEEKGASLTRAEQSSKAATQQPAAATAAAAAAATEWGEWKSEDDVRWKEDDCPLACEEAPSSLTQKSRPVTASSREA